MNRHLIELEAAVQTIVEKPDLTPDEKLNIIKRLNALPSVQPDGVSTGRWVADESGVILCPFCGEEHEWELFRASYCDNCGSRLLPEEGYGEEDK